MAAPFITQRLGNKFPLWTKLRSDPSSFGQRFYSTPAEEFESFRASLVKSREMLRLLSFCNEPEDAWAIHLDSDDEYPISHSFGKRSVTYPTVTGTLSGTDYTLVRASYSEDLFYSFPTRLSEGAAVSVSFDVWDSSAPSTYGSFTRPERLSVYINNSTDYKATALDAGFGGQSGVLLTGEDPNHVEIQEFVQVDDDGVYLTREILDALTDVQYDGFDGDIVISAGAPNREYVEDMFRVAVLPELEGPLRYSLYNRSGENYLKIWTPIYLDGSEYRRDNGIDEANEEIIAIQRLLDSDENPIDAVDLCVSPYDTRLYVCDSSGDIHVYDPGLSEFTPPDTEESYQTYIELIPLYNRVALNETLTVFTWFRVMRAPVGNVRISRVDPAGTTTYLQSDHSWGAASCYFANTGELTLPEDSWKDKTFTSTFDQLGQWDLYLEVNFIGMGGTTYTSHTAIVCESLIAGVSLETSISSPTGLFFSHTGELCVCETNSYTPITLHSDYWYADVDTQRMFLKEQYDSVEVTYG